MCWFTLEMLSLAVCFVLCLCGAQSGVLPVDKCSLDDSKCLVSEFQKAVPAFMAGIPDLDVEVEDAMELDKIQFDLSGLKFGLTEGRVKGLKNLVIDNVNWLQEKNKFEVDFHTNASIKGNYTAGGRILILPITGDGLFALKLKNLAVKFFVEYAMEKDANGMDIVAPKKFEFTYDVKDNAHFTLSGLFNGNKELSDAMHTFLNENWKQIVAEFGTPIIQTAAKKLFKNVSNFFKHSPINEIATIA